MSSPLLQAYPAYQLAAAAALAQSQMAELQRNLQLQQQNFLRRQQMNEEHDQPSSTTQEPSAASVSGDKLDIVFEYANSEMNNLPYRTSK